MRNFSSARRVVVKVGTNVLTRSGSVDTEFLRSIAGQIAELVGQKRQVILVSSGAIGMGAGLLGLKPKISDVKLRQACAAVGQGILMHEYQEAFRAYNQKVAQVLLTNRIMSNRRYYVNLKNSVETLLGLGVVPIINENDCVSIEEIDLAFGDNDRLSALVASKIDAELLIILTDVEGLFDRNPRKDDRAELIRLVPEITPEIVALAGQAGSALGTGGMASKIAAIRMAADAGCMTVLAHGRVDGVIPRIVAGEEIGTLFLPKRRLSNRKRWIMNSRAQGTIEIDAGAADAIRHRRSLLLVGIASVEGTFGAGDVVRIGSTAKGVSGVSSAELSGLLKEQKSEQSEDIKDAPRVKRKAIVHVNDLVVLEGG